MSTSVRSRAASGVFWTALQVWTVRATTAGAFVILSRQLTPAQFGLISLAMAVISVLSLLSDSGLATFVIRAPKIDALLLSTAFWTTMVLSFVLAGSLAAASGLLAQAFDEPGLTAVLLALSASLVLTGLNSVPSALLKREMKFKQLAARGTFATFVGSAVAIVLALNGAGVWALVAQTLVRGVISVVITWTAVRWFPSFRWHGKQARDMLAFGGQLLGIDLMVQARDRGQDFILAGVSGTTALGLWSVANRLLRIIQETGSSVISSVATPAFAKLQGDRSRVFRAYEVALATSGAVMFPIMLFLAVTSPDLVPLLLGQQWAVTAHLAQIMALSAVITTFSYFDRPIFVALDKLRPELALVFTSVALQLVVVVAFVGQGLEVLAVALLVRGLLFVPLRFVTLHRVTGMPFGVMIRPLRVLGAALLMAAACWALNSALDDVGGWTRTGLTALCAALVYPPALWLFARPVVTELVGDVRRVRQRRLKPPAERIGVSEPVESAADPALPTTSVGSGLPVERP